MRIFGIIALGLALLIGGGIVWYKAKYPTYSYRYRMSVDVDVDGQIHSGSSVIEVKINKQEPIGSAPPQVSRVYGEAIFLELGRGRNVTALLAEGTRARNVDYPYNIVPTLFGLTYADIDLHKLVKLRGSRDVPASLMPTFVTFKDINDPASARVVDPAEFGKEFGPDVRLRDVKVEMTDDPISRGIEKHFPWWNGPFPWLKPMHPGSDTYIDTRPWNSFRWDKGMLQRAY